METGAHSGRSQKVPRMQRTGGSNSNHVVRCAMSRTKSQGPRGVVNSNPPGEILSENDTLMRDSRVAVAEELIEYIVQKCLGRSSDYNQTICVSRIKAQRR